MHERLDILARDAGDRMPPKQWLDVAFDAPAVGRKRAGLLRRSPTGHYAPGFGVGQIQVAQVGNRLCVPGRSLLRGRVRFVCDAP
jgi:hypothetical protein